jgi:hypothetical protein
VGYTLVWALLYVLVGIGLLVGLIGIHHSVVEEDISSIDATTVAC